jgi:hypothetical protein
VETPNYKEYKLKYFAQKYIIPLVIIFFVMLPIVFFALFVYGMMTFLTADAKKNKKNK